MSGWRFWLGVVLILGVAWWLRVADFAEIPPGVYYDDGRLLQRAWRLTEGYGLALYFQDIAEPFDQIVRAGFHALTGGVNWEMARLFTAWLNLLGIAATIATGRAFFRDRRYRDYAALFAGLVLATLPPAVMIGRHLYRANWLPLTIALTLLFLLRAWRKPTPHYFALAGGFTGLTMLFYTGGLLFPPVILLLLGLMWILCRCAWPRLAHWLAFAVGLGVALLPWMILYLRVPGWLSRVADLSAGESPLSEPSLLIPHLQMTLTSIFLPDTLHDMRYAPFTTGFLNPALLVLFALGVLVAIWRWRTPWRLAPLLIFAAMIWTNVLSSEPYQPVRVVGIFVPMALLVAMGAMGISHLIPSSVPPLRRRKPSPSLQSGEGFREGMRSAGSPRQLLKQRYHTSNIAWIILGLIALFTPFYSAYHIAYHYNEQPLITDPHVPNSLALKYRIGYVDLLQQFITSDAPIYLPLEHLNTDLAVAILRLEAFPTVRPYQDGESLPAGRVVLPIDSISYGFFRYQQTPVQYGLLLPESGEIVILPPLDADSAEALYSQVRDSGMDVRSAGGWVLGQEFAFTPQVNPFAGVQIRSGDALATYGNIDLVGIDMPQELTPGTTIPVTLYWRLREGHAPDYFSRLQLWDFNDSNQGYERRSPLVNEPDFPLNILYNIYPTVMWQPGQIVPDTRYIPLNENAPAGGYRFGLAVYEYPGLVPLAAENAISSEEWALVGRSAVERERFVTAQESTSTIATVGDHFALVDCVVSPPLDTVEPGATITLQLDWRVLQPTNESLIHFVHLLDANGELIAQQDVVPFAQQFPTWAWPLDEIITPTFSLTIPDASQPPYSLRAGMYRYPALENLPVQQEDETALSVRLACDSNQD